MYGIPYGAPYGADFRTTRFTETISDGIEVADALIPTLVDVIREFARAQADVSTRADLTNIVTDNAEARDYAIRVLSELIAEQVSSADTVASVYAAIGRILDAVVASEACSNTLDAKNALVEAIYASTLLSRSFPYSVAEAMQLHESMQHSLVAAIRLVDMAAAEDTAAESVTITKVIDEAVEASDLVTHLIEATNTISERVLCVVTLTIDGKVYTGVVINPASGAATEYTDYPLNSFLPDLDGKYYGVAKDGIYWLDGDDDDGEPINWRVRSGLLSIAGGIRARVPDAYFNITSTGDLIVKAIVVADDGQKSEYWYKLEKRESTAPRNTRVKIGRGLAADRWQYELVPIDGARARLEDMKVHPLILSRRI